MVPRNTLRAVCEPVNKSVHKSQLQYKGKAWIYSIKSETDKACNSCAYFPITLLHWSFKNLIRQELQMVVKAGSLNTFPQWYVYMIKASDGSLYTGVTTDVQRRFDEHCSPNKGARFFRGRKPLEVVYSEIHPDRSSALKREAAIKRLTRAEKLALLG